MELTYKKNIEAVLRTDEGFVLAIQLDDQNTVRGGQWSDDRVRKTLVRLFVINRQTPAPEELDRACVFIQCVRKREFPRTGEDLVPDPHF